MPEETATRAPLRTEERGQATLPYLLLFVEPLLMARPVILRRTFWHWNQTASRYRARFDLRNMLC